MLDTPSLLIGLGIGMLIGGLAAWLIVEQRRQQVQQALAQVQGEQRALQAQLTSSETQVQEYRLKQIEHQEQVLDLTRDLSRMQESYAQLNQTLSQREADLERLQERFKAEFENLAGRVMEENARKLGFENGAALYPMVTMNGEECHNEWEITFEEIHRNGAIAYAIFNYTRYFGDESYLLREGLEVLIAICRFWAQRFNWSDEKKQYVMLGVTVLLPVGLIIWFRKKGWL